MASPEAVANYFLAKSFDEGIALTPMQLLKLVYIAHGWHLGYFDQNLIDGAVEAWRYGPVIPSVYHKIKKYGRYHISALIDGVDPEDDIESNPPHEDTMDLLANVWEAYKDKNGIELSALTHEKNTPWDIAWSSPDEPGHYSPNKIISNKLIAQHYKELMKG
ncbi:DUF4065 domain-containing protein [Halomonas sp. PAMB 3232]|uniref:Panacea domain-containing protein n=1 Tax=Halomonas sp. PAMB 3232 TaxID=3075221 RepID=UPI002899C699|nr:type II toxin-antitoxin system antitoxin SocA domain-containing protein [Halomonas sp. PAMB 3232]WNL39302.1 DUF4065 domain-containing protein [Halomonas sp. PAMB 3232]